MREESESRVAKRELDEPTHIVAEISFVSVAIARRLATTMIQGRSS